MMNNREAIKKLLQLLYPYIKSLIFIVFCLLLSTVISLCIPIISKNIMDVGFIGRNRKMLLILSVISFMLWLINDCLDIKLTCIVLLFIPIKYIITKKLDEKRKCYVKEYNTK